MSEWKEHRTSLSYKEEVQELRKELALYEAVADERERLALENERLASMLDRSGRLLRARIDELIAANDALRAVNVALSTENEYLQKVVNAAATLGDSFRKAVFENMEV